MPRFRPLNLTRHFNSSARLGRPRWNKALEAMVDKIPRGPQTAWGIAFRLGPRNVDARGLIALAKGAEVAVPIGARATHVCFFHFCDSPKAPSAGGEPFAEYVLRYRDGTEHAQPIRRRFEVSAFGAGWMDNAFAAQGSRMRGLATPENTPAWGVCQTGVSGGAGPGGCWIYALENPRPEQPIASVLLRGAAKQPLAVLGITLYDGPGHPLRHVPRRIYRLVLPPREKVLTRDLQAEIDMGIITRVWAVPAKVDAAWLKAPERGLGMPRAPEAPGREFLVEATGAEGARLSVKAGRAKKRDIPFGDAWSRGRAQSADGQARVTLAHPRRQWMFVTVTDATTGKPTPTRIHFAGPDGEYIPPYGHHAVVNDNWFEDYGGDLQLGAQSFAYVPGRFQTDMPVGEVYVEINKGFEYEPVRKRLQIRAGQRQLNLAINRWRDLRKEGWVTADTHVHFISPQTAWLEGQGEGLNLINLLASQWGRLFTNAADISGQLSGCSGDDTLVWVGTENRHHLLGHISMLGTHGDPVYPMCAGGPGEAYIGDPDIMTMTQWAQTCKERDGVVIRPHFPGPSCEEPVYFALGQLDGTELRNFANPDSGSLDEFCFKEWYRYLNCGYRTAAVGGTDKMSAGMPVGGVRTYARLGRSQGFTFENWGRAIRAGRTFTTSGPLLDLQVDGHSIGDEIRIPGRRATVEVEARAECAWPIDLLEVVVNGTVVAAASSRRGARALSLREQVRLEGSCWIAARCGSRTRVNHCWPIHLGAHTSPIYVIAAGQVIFSPSDATYMLTLIDGGVTYLDTLSVRFDEKRHRAMKAIFEKARREIARRL